MKWTYYLRLPLLPILFVWLLAYNAWRLNRQAWTWTVGTMRGVHCDMRRNFAKRRGTTNGGNA